MAPALGQMTMGPSAPISATPYPVHQQSPLTSLQNIPESDWPHPPAVLYLVMPPSLLPGLFLGLPALNLSLIVPILLKLTQVCLICSKPCNAPRNSEEEPKSFPAPKAQHGLPSPLLDFVPQPSIAPPLLQLCCCSPGTPATFSPPHSLCTCWSLGWK